MNEAQRLGLGATTRLGGIPTSPEVRKAARLIKYADKVRVRRSATTTQIDHADGRSSATVRPATIRQTISLSGKGHHE